jgi:hypothetical protein
MIVIPGWDGMNLQRFTFWFNQLMRTPDKDVDPITIKYNIQMNCFTIKDGRHRFLATVFACRPTIPCVVDVQTDVDYTKMILGDYPDV